MSKKQQEKAIIKQATEGDYKFGFVSDIEMEVAPKGLSEDIIRMISAKKSEPAFMLRERLKAFRLWKTLEEPHWGNHTYEPIKYDELSYYAAPKEKNKLKSLDEVDPDVLKTFEKLGISLAEQKRLSNVAVDAVLDSVSVVTTYKEELKKLGIIFCSISEAIQDHPELIKKYFGTVVSYSDHFFAALNAAVFTDGSFVYVPKGVRCPMELSTYFRINAENTGQFERTLIIADEGSYVSYLEGCTAPMRDEHQLHAATVEIIAEKNAEVKYSTVQNWYPGDENGKGGVYNFVTKRGICKGEHSKISWTQVETGSAITWKYPSVILKGDYSEGEFYSVALTKNYQQADTGTKMIHIGKHTKSTIVSKGISAGHGKNTYRGIVSFNENAENSSNASQCDSLILGKDAQAHTFPTVESRRSDSRVEHEASTSTIHADQLLYLQSRGLDEPTARALIANGYCKEVFKKLPMEFAVEAQNLLALSMEDSVG
jgi:Fe-S cluster assembly protein SufB